MATTYSFIASSSVGSGGSNGITFSNIPQTYQDLAILISARQDTTDVNANIRFNSNSSSIYDLVIMDNQGSPSPRTYTSLSQTSFGVGLTTHSGFGSNIFSASKIYIPAYTGSNNKTVWFLANDPNNVNSAQSAYLGAYGGVWKNTSAITSITLTPASSQFVQYSTFYLYGIKKS